MYLPLLMLSIAVSGWFAWRRSPRYTAKRTAWTFVAMVSAGLLVSLPAFWIIPSLPESAAIPVYIGLVLLVTLGACAVILRVTDGAMAKPRAGAVIVKLHRRKVNR